MHGGAAVGILVLLFVGVPLLSLVRSAARARGSQGQPRPRGGIVSGWFAHRRALALENVRHLNSLVRDKARHEQRLTEQKTARQAREEVREDRGPDRAPLQDDEVPRPDKKPAAAEPQEPPTIEGVVVTTDSPAARAVPGVEMVIEGLRAIYSHAMSGNIQAKRRGALALVEVARSASLTALTMGRAMGEPGQHYGPAVTEKLSRMSAAFTMAMTAGAEADGELHAILNTTPAEAMAAGRPMPHHGQFSETGAN